MSLAAHALGSDTEMCRPRMLRDGAAGGATGERPVLRAVALRHPAGLPGRGGAFVPNDVTLGGASAAPFVVLSGPNMGGKSTVLRQACLAALLAQVCPPEARLGQAAPSPLRHPMSHAWALLPLYPALSLP
eukprot:356227-Chlamydomonas_euryale.AAC.2